MTLCGYSLPLSPSGEASAVTPPPWHFTGDVVMVTYQAEPELARRLLPPELDLGRQPGAAAAVFASWQWCSQSGAERLEPSRNQFNEFLILLACEYQGIQLARCPFVWVDQPVPMVRGWIQGMPKQFGSVHLSRPGTVGTAAPRLEPGGCFAGTASAYGRPLADLTISITGSSAEPPALHAVPMVHSLSFPDWLTGTSGKQNLVMSEVTDVEFSRIWAGSGIFRLETDQTKDLALIAPIEVGAGYVFSYAETVCGGKPLLT